MNVLKRVSRVSDQSLHERRMNGSRPKKVKTLAMAVVSEEPEGFCLIVFPAISDHRHADLQKP